MTDTVCQILPNYLTIRKIQNYDKKFHIVSDL